MRGVVVEQIMMEQYLIMEENAKKKSSDKKRRYRRPAFTIVDWIIAAFSIALLVYIIINLPPA